jgi:hypothetical protein
MSKKDYLSMYGVDIYDRFVGNQSPKDFMDYSPNMTIDQAVNNYAEKSEYFTDLNQEVKDHIISEIIDYIDAKIKE